MDIRTLQYFLMVAKEKSITKAAKELNMTQPPLSRAMKDLEDEIGKVLFVRGSKYITLTEDGMLLKKRAEEIVSLMDKTINELSYQDNNITGEVLIAAGETDKISLITNIAKNISENHPDITYKIYSGDLNLVRDKIDNGLVDFGLILGIVDVEKYEYIQLPYHDTWGVLMLENDSLSKYDKIYPSQLIDQPLILSHQSYNSGEMLNYLKVDNQLPKVVATYELAYNASFFVRNGFGYMLTLENIINTTNSGLVFRPLSPLIQANLYIIWKKNQVFSKASKLFLDEIRNELNRRNG